MKHNINEDKELKKAILLMGYDTSKTLNENIKTLDEQVPYADEFGEPSPVAQPEPEAEPSVEAQGKESNVMTDEDLLGNTNKFRSFFQQLSDFGVTPVGGPIVGGITTALGLPNLLDALGINVANIMGGRRTGVKGVVDALDGWVDEEDLTYVLTIIRTLEGKCHLDDVQDPPILVPAMKRFLELYSEDEGGSNLISDIEGVGTRTLPAGSEKLKQKAIALITKYLNETCEQEQEAGQEDGEKEFTEPIPDEKRQTYGPCTDYPFTIGCINEAIKKMQECLGLKPDGMFGPKTMAGIKAKIPEFNGQITQEVYDTIMNICRKNQRGLNTPINKLEPKTSGQPLNKNVATIKQRPGMTPEQVYQQLAPHLDGKGRRRIKYKGTPLDQDTLSKLSQYLGQIGYKATKADPTKDYGAKYVWIKK